jgi:hypothetical protein
MKSFNLKKLQPKEIDMTQNITYSTAIEQAIDAVMHHCADDATKNSVIKRLDALKNFELNMGILSVAMCNIRTDAIKAKQAIRDGNTTTEEVLNTLNQIEKTADSLHNVGGFMASGIACDAAYLLYHGVDNRWPTGIAGVEHKVFASSKTAVTRQENRAEFAPTAAEIQRIKDGLRITVEPLQGYEDRSSFDPEIFTNKSLRFCSSSINKGAKDEGNV